MASEVTFDLGNEFRDPDYLCSGDYFLSLFLKSLLFPNKFLRPRRLAAASEFGSGLGGWQGPRSSGAASEVGRGL